MKTQVKNLAVVVIVLLVIIVMCFILFSQPTEKGKNVDIIPPEITSITGNITGFAGRSMIISAMFSDDSGVTSAELFYRSASVMQWGSKLILNGNVSIVLPSNPPENLYYYIVVDDAAGNGPVGNPSVDGSLYYTITVQNAADEDNDDGERFNQTHKGYVFLELPKPKISCSECPKIAAMVDELYDSGDYPFYFVTLPEENENAAARLEEYNVWGYPTIYFDGGVDLIVGSNIEKSTIANKIFSTASREHANLSITVTAEHEENSSEITLSLVTHNYEDQMYTGQLRIYLTEIVSTTGQGNAPTHFSFVEYLLNEQIQIATKDSTSLEKIVDISEFDPENLMIFAVVSNVETHTGFSQPPDKNQFNAHYVDAIDATTVVKDGNLLPEVGIQTPAAKYLYRFGEQVKKTLLGNTILLGKTTLVAYASDDSKIEKIEFYIDGTLMKTITDEPYEWLWHQFTVGKRNITVKAYDDKGKTATATIDVLVFMKWPDLFSHDG